MFKIAIEKDNYLYQNIPYKVVKILTTSEIDTEFDCNHSPVVSVTRF